MDSRLCEIRSWPVFCPGTYKPSGEYFSPADTHAFGDNFAAYSANGNPALRPLIKIGHDRSQRYAKSFGFPSLGEVVEAHTEPNGTFVVDRAVGIPRIVGSAINSGFLRSGSIELPPRGAWRPPDDPGAEIKGDVVSGIALLGEELPAVPGFAGPKAVFADGTPVPPLTDEEQLWWLEHMAKVANKPDDDEESFTLVGAGKDTDQDSTYAARSLCFSALTFEPQGTESMDAPAILAALQADPMLMEQVMAALAPPVGAAPLPVEPVAVEAPGDNFAAAAEKESKMANKTAEGDLFSAFNAFAADCGKRMSAMEAKFSAMQEKDDAAQMSAFSAMVDNDVKANDLASKVPPVSLPGVKKSMLDTLTAKTFASESDRKAAYDGIVRTFAALPVNPMLRDSVQDKEKAGNNLATLAATNPQLNGMLKSDTLRRAFPVSVPQIAQKFGVQLA